MSNANFHCNSLTTVQNIQDYASLIFWDRVYTEYTKLAGLLFDFSLIQQVL